jgi:osmotically inducible protein OsmC
VAAERTASATWSGNLTEGSGTVHSFGSGALSELPVTWAARTGESNGKTSPEELIAAAHSACFCMAFSNMLFKKGHTAEELNATAVVTFVPGTGITTSALTVRGRVPGMSEADFLATAEEARAGCPVSGALAGVEITLDATFES